MRKPIYFYTQLSGDWEAASHQLAGDPESFLPPPAIPTDGGFAVDLVAEGMSGVPEVSAIVCLDDPPVLATSRLIIRPVRWRAAVADSLFPLLNADLELEWLAEGTMRLALVGSYRPPLSVVGAAADQLLGRHVAEAVVRRFVLDVAARITEGSTLAV